jgi:M6 family metalloprotease-like protein
MSVKRVLSVFCLVMFMILLLGCEKKVEYTGTHVDVVVILYKLTKQPFCPTAESCEPWWGPGDLANLGPPRHSASEYGSVLDQLINDYYQKATYGQVYFSFHVLVNPNSSDGWWEAPGAVWEYNQGRDIYMDGVQTAYSVLGDNLLGFSHFLVIQADHDHSGQECCLHQPSPYYPIPRDYVIDGKTFPLLGSWVSEGVSDEALAAIASHELGHQLGAPDQYQDDTGPFTGMGPYDIMGWDLAFDHFGAWTKLDRGWISWTGNTTRLPCISGECEITTTLDPLEYPGNNALLIPWYDWSTFMGLMAECRRPVNHDENIPESGVLLTTINPFLFNLQYTAAQVTSPTNDFMTAMLKPGETYLDVGRGIRVTNLTVPGEETCTVKAERLANVVPSPDPIIRQASDEVETGITLYLSPDIWNDTAINGYQIFPDTPQNEERIDIVNQPFPNNNPGYFWYPYGTGDPIWLGHLNKIYFRIQNYGMTAAGNIGVRVYIHQPLTFSVQNPNCGASSGMPMLQENRLPAGVFTIPHLEPGENFVESVDWWAPETPTPVRVEVVIDDYPGEASTSNNTASETFATYHRSPVSAGDQSTEIGDVQLYLPEECQWGVPFMVLPMESEASLPGDIWQYFTEPAQGFILPGETVHVSVRATPPENGNPGDCSSGMVGVLFPINDVFATVGDLTFETCVTQPSTLTCSAPGEAVPLGSSAVITGNLMPALAQLIALQVTDPAGVSVYQNVSTDASGAYSDTVVPGVTGTWTVQAFWGGNSSYALAESAQCTFEVTRQTAPTFTLERNTNCRSGADTAFNVLEILLAGARLPIEGRNADSSWFYVHTLEDVKCWVSSTSGYPEGELTGVPVLVSQPTPTPTPASPCPGYTTLETCNGHGCIWSEDNHSCHAP